MRAPPTPSSLKWLIDRHARLQGELIKLKKKFEINHHQEKCLSDELQVVQMDLQRLTQIQAALASELDALALLLGRHEVFINPALITPIREQERCAITKHGRITASIFEAIKSAPDGRPSTTEVTSFVIIRLGLKLDIKDFVDFRIQIRRRLKDLAGVGRLVRVGNKGDYVEQRWARTESVHSNAPKLPV